jgi:diguanylate cyclase (GGDEF)-like protein
MTSMFEQGALSRRSSIALLGCAVLYCGSILWLDIDTVSDFSEAFLYSLALILVYPIKRTWAIWFITALGVGFTILGKLFEVEGEPGLGGLYNRGLSMVVQAAFGFLLWRIISVEQVLFRLSTADALTGALNRRHFMTLMAREQRRAERYGARYALLMCDIDHFKRVNDTYGHQVGDEAIKGLAKVALAHLRPTDLLCRYGGEEFIVVLTHTEEAGARIAAERIRAAISQLEIPTAGTVLRFTVSIGVATFVRGNTVEQVIECADQALYAAKSGGRNQVQVGRLPGADTAREAAAAAVN